MPAYHITWVTHNSRVSERMISYRVPSGEPVLLTPEQEVEITQSILRTVRHNNITVLAFNCCVDHVHMILVCHPNRRDPLVGRLKSESTNRYKSKHRIKNKFHLWAQKYDYRIIENDDYLFNTIEYVRFNRYWHQLPPNPGLRPVVTQMVTEIDNVKDWEYPKWI